MEKDKKDMGRTQEDFSLCSHCGKKITGKAMLSGLAFICPYCGKPTGNGSPKTGYKWGANTFLDSNPKSDAEKKK